MTQTYFADGTLAAGSTSRTFTPPIVQGGALTLLLTVHRDDGLILASGEYDINQAAVVSVRQLQADGTTSETLVTGNCIGATSAELFIPNQAAGVISIYNAGPGNVRNVTVSDLDVR
jgi:hypothetical protein